MIRLSNEDFTAFNRACKRIRLAGKTQDLESLIVLHKICEKHVGTQLALHAVNRIVKRLKEFSPLDYIKLIHTRTVSAEDYATLRKLSASCKTGFLSDSERAQLVAICKSEAIATKVLSHMRSTSKMRTIIATILSGDENEQTI